VPSTVNLGRRIVYVDDDCFLALHRTITTSFVFNEHVRVTCRAKYDEYVRRTSYMASGVDKKQTPLGELRAFLRTS